MYVLLLHRKYRTLNLSNFLFLLMMETCPSWSGEVSCCCNQDQPMDSVHWLHKFSNMPWCFVISVLWRFMHIHRTCA